jgi:hypothetical protein
MRFYAILDFQYWALALFIGLSGAITACIAWGTYSRQRKREAEEKMEKMDVYEVATSHDIEKNPVAPFLIFAYILIVLWAVGYMIIMGVRGGSI